NASEHELMQYRSPVWVGPSSKTCPRCPPQRRQTTSVRRMNRLLSGRNSTASATAGWSKLGHPVPESNLASELTPLQYSVLRRAGLGGGGLAEAGPPGARVELGIRADPVAVQRPASGAH